MASHSDPVPHWVHVADYELHPPEKTLLYLLALRRFVRIRHYGVLANRHRKEKIARCRDLLGARTPEAPESESVCEKLLRLSGIDLLRCPACREGRMIAIAEIPRLAMPSSHPIRAPALEAA